jgi:hypothetical protein
MMFREKLNNWKKKYPIFNPNIEKGVKIYAESGKYLKGKR